VVPLVAGTFLAANLRVTNADTMRSQLQRRLEQVDADIKSELHLTFKNNQRPPAAIERAYLHDQVL